MGYYHPDSVEGIARDSSKTTLDSLNLQVNDEILYLYDFGHNSLFDIKVISIGETDQKFEPFIVAGQGRVYVYPDDPEECMGFLKDLEMKPVSFRVQEDDYYFYENLLQASGSHVKHMVTVYFDNEFDGNINKPKACYDISYAIKNDYPKLFNLIYPEAFAFLRDLFLGNVTAGKLNKQLIKHICLIGSLGLIDVSVEPGDGGDRLIIYLPKDYKDFHAFLTSSEFDRIIKERTVLDNALNIILDLYGVVEEDKLFELLKSMFGIETDPSLFNLEILFPRIVEMSVYFMLGSKMNYISRYAYLDLMRVFSSRENLDGLGYKEFTSEEVEIIKTVGIRGIIKNYNKFVNKIAPFVDSDMNSIMDAFDNALALRAKGTDIIEVMSFFEGKLDMNWKVVTPEVKRLFTNILNECPMHTYRGLSYKEACYLSNL